MAAWSDHEGDWNDPDVGRISMPERNWELFSKPVSTPDATPSTEPFPLEVWTFFTDADLDQLVVDACAEMGRRELARQFVCGHHDCAPEGCRHDA